MCPFKTNEGFVGGDSRMARRNTESFTWRVVWVLVVWAVCSSSVVSALPESPLGGGTAGAGGPMLGLFPGFDEGMVADATCLALDCPSVLDQVKGASGVRFIDRAGAARALDEVLDVEQVPGQRLGWTVRETDLSETRVTLDRAFLDAEGFSLPEFAFTEDDGDSWQPLTPRRVGSELFVTVRPEVEEYRFRVEQAGPPWSLAGLVAGDRVAGWGSNHSVLLDRQEGMYWKLAMRAGAVVVDLEPLAGYGNKGAPVFFNKTWLAGQGITTPLFEWGHVKTWKPLHATETAEGWWVEPESFSQIGVHEVASGETEAYLNVLGRELMSADFDGNDNFDTQTFTDTSVVSQKVQLTLDSSQDVVSSFTNEADYSNVVLGTPLHFPTTPASDGALCVGGARAIAVGTDGYTYAWGSGASGRIGDGATTTRTTPVKVVTGEQNDPSGFLRNVAKVACGGVHAYALLDDGKVMAWGDGFGGRIGNDATTNHLSPVFVHDGAMGTASGHLEDIVEIAARNQGGYALRDDGTVWAWGSAQAGANGDGSSTQRNTPVQVVGGEQGGSFLTGAVSVTALNSAGFAVLDDGRAVGWGGGVTGDGDATSANSPQWVHTGEQGDASGHLQGVLEMAGSHFGSHIVVRLDTGEVMAFGSGGKGQLGVSPPPTQELEPVFVLSGDQGAHTRLNDIKDVGAGDEVSFALDNTGKVWAWGHNNAGQAGTQSGPPASNPETPKRVLTGEQADASGFFTGAGMAPSGSGQTTFVATTTGAVYGFGFHDGYIIGSGQSDSFEWEPTRTLGGAQGTQYLESEAGQGTSTITSGHYTSEVISSYYEITAFNDDRTAVGSATATLEWRSGWSETPSGLTWSDWASGVPPKARYYQYKYTFAKPDGDITSEISVNSLSITRSVFRASGNSVVQWTVPGGLEAASVTLTREDTVADESTILYEIKNGATSYATITPGAEYTFATPHSAVYLRISLTRDWETPTVDSVTLNWAAEGEETVNGGTTRTAGSTSEINEATVTPTTSLGAADLVVPVSTASLAVLSVEAPGGSPLPAAPSIAALDVGEYYFDAAGLFVHVGVTATEGVPINYYVNTSYGASFDIIAPTLLESGDYYTVSGTIRDVDGLPVTNVVTDIEFFENGELVFGPHKKFVIEGNIESSISSNFLEPGEYDVVISFTDSNDIKFQEGRSVTIGSRTPVIVGGGGFSSYSGALIEFNVFNSNTGFGMDQKTLKLLATEDGAPTTSNRLLEPVFPTAVGQTVNYRVEDYWGKKVYPVGGEAYDSITVDSKRTFVDIGLNLVSFKVKNTNSSVIHFQMAKGSATLSEYILPQEVVKFDVLPAVYNLTLDYYDSQFGFLEQSVAENGFEIDSDIFYWIKGHELADIVIEVNNVGSDITNQVVDVQVSLNNVNSTIGTQIVSVETRITNLETNITTQLNAVEVDIANLDSAIGSQLNTVLAEISNSNTTVNSQLNFIKSKVSNSESNLTIQINNFESSVDNQLGSIENQVNVVQTKITNTETNITTQLNTIETTIENNFDYRDTYRPVAGMGLHWGLNERGDENPTAVSNGGFEEYPVTPGPPTDWTKWCNTEGNTVAREGDSKSGYAVRLEGSPGTDLCLRQVVGTLDDGVSYYFSAWAKTDGAGEAVAVLHDSTVGQNMVYSQGSTASTTYERLDGTFVAEAGHTYTVYLYALDGDTTMYDEVALRQVSAQDLSGNDLDGALHGPDILHRGKTGLAYSFDGVDDYVLAPGSPAGKAPDELSMEVWVKPTQVDESGKVMQLGEGSDGTSHIDISMSGGVPHYAARKTGFGIGASGSFVEEIPVNEWSHLFLVYDAPTVRLYYNGEEMSSWGLAADFLSGLDTVSLGADVDGGGAGVPENFYGGFIDEAVVYNRALSAEEVRYRYEASTPFYQFNNLNVLIENNDADIDTQLNTIETAITNNDADIDTQLNAILATVTNNNATINQQLNFIRNQVSNVEGNLTVQINSFEASVNNQFTDIDTQIVTTRTSVINAEANITTQLNTIEVQIENTNSSLASQVNSVSIQIQNHDTEMDAQINQVLATIQNSNASIIDQVNLLRNEVLNQNSSITTQFNGLRSQITVLESNVTNLFSITRTDIAFVNSTIHNRIEDMNATLYAQMVATLDNVTKEGDRVFNKTVDVLNQVLSSTNELDTRVVQKTVEIIDKITAVETEIVENVNSTLRDVNGTVVDVRNRLENRTSSILDSLDSVLAAVGDVNFTGIEGVLEALDNVLETFNAPHTVYVPAFNYTAVQNDVSKPKSFLRVSQHPTALNGAIVEWGSKDDTLLLTTKLEQKSVTGAWSLIQTSTSSQGSLTLSDLTVGGTYYFRSQAKDAAGNVEDMGTDESHSNFVVFVAGNGTQVVPGGEAPESALKAFVPAPSIAMVIAMVGISIIGIRRKLQ